MFTRLSNAFIMKVKDHTVAISIYCKCYSFAQLHYALVNESCKNIYICPAKPVTRAELAYYVWTLEEMIENDLG